MRIVLEKDILLTWHTKYLYEYSLWVKNNLNLTKKQLRQGRGAGNISTQLFNHKALKNCRNKYIFWSIVTFLFNFPDVDIFSRLCHFFLRNVTFFLSTWKHVGFILSVLMAHIEKYNKLRIFIWVHVLLVNFNYYYFYTLLTGLLVNFYFI